MTDTKVVGRIIKLNKSGWGFIISKEIQFTRIFFHWTALRQDTLPFLELRVGMDVEFSPLPIPGRGVRAIRVKVVPKKETHVEPITESSEVPPLS